MALDIEAPGGNEADLQRALSNLREFRGARIRMNADDTAQNITTEAAITFDVADFDTDSFWSAGSPTRLTIPSGVAYVALVGQAQTSASTADTFVNLNVRHFNSAGTLQKYFGPRFVEMGNTTRILQATTGPVAVTAGDYFQLWLREESDTSVTIEGDDAGQTFLSLQVLGT